VHRLDPVLAVAERRRLPAPSARLMTIGERRLRGASGGIGSFARSPGHFVQKPGQVPGCGQTLRLALGS
jgi:hypothetical protein